MVEKTKSISLKSNKLITTLKNGISIIFDIPFFYFV